MTFKKHILALMGIWCVSWVAGGLPGPADPYSSFFFTIVIFPVAVLAYALGAIVALRGIPQQDGRPRTFRLLVLVAVVFFGSIIIGWWEISRHLRAQPIPAAKIAVARTSSLEELRDELVGHGLANVESTLGGSSFRMESGDKLEWYYREQPANRQISDIN